ncbi:OmpW/AlkL family protein [Parerythrobacter jejuensis]|uniref:Outer membrane beta-barrel protein n=1 Tax=Parerythrobacter jejuensis TaxID=795812 RepID=A0A845AVK3_9SPHN|nr:OmpW family outer membrane protein [Parerythrobacter jejuensis]MXP30453.1 outer membrane beta-barrel protein [Parerythrobacter jejuensis]MXP33213.1 outer membrane beta-barrel protein [Parerythrobacter jejuensis]
MLKTSLLAASAFAAMALPVSAASAQEAGDIQVRAFVTGVLPDGEITDVNADLFGLPADAQTNVTDSVVPTIAAEYFIASNFSIETICCITTTDVDGIGGLAGTNLINNAIVLPATLTGKFHLTNDSGFKPYIGGGVTHFFIFDEGVGPDAAALGIDDVNLSNEFGFVLQAGADIDLNDTGMVLGVDVKRYFVDTTANFNAGGVNIINTDHKLDPWVISAGLGFRF